VFLMWTGYQTVWLQHHSGVFRLCQSQDAFHPHLSLSHLTPCQGKLLGSGSGPQRYGPPPAPPSRISGKWKFVDGRRAKLCHSTRDSPKSWNTIWSCFCSLWLRKKTKSHVFFLCNLKMSVSHNPRTNLTHTRTIPALSRVLWVRQGGSGELGLAAACWQCNASLREAVSLPRALGPLGNGSFQVSPKVHGQVVVLPHLGMFSCCERSDFSNVLQT